MTEVFVMPGDCMMSLQTLPDNSVDSVVTDPPYALVSIVKRFGGENAAPATGDVYARASAGFMGKTWDTGETAFAVPFWQECLRVLKPGGHVLAFSGSRTYHRLAVAIEDAGFEIRDQIMWLYGSGFPKSHDVSKGIDKAAGAERAVVGVAGRSGSVRNSMAGDFAGGEYMETAPETDSAKQWEGWGTALKPAHEPIVMARKPLIGTVVANVLEHGTGAVNVDGCRVTGDIPTSFPKRRTPNGSHVLAAGFHRTAEETAEASPLGRWPANVIHDGSEEVLNAFPNAGGAQAPVRGTEASAKTSNTFGDYAERAPSDRRDGGGSAARFFYTAKASKADRGEGNNHPTVKPQALMRYLCRLVTPPGGVVLDPFAGSGSTGLAARSEGFTAWLMEREPEYLEIIRKRLTPA